MALKHKRSDAGKLGVPKRSREALLLSEKVSTVQRIFGERDHIHISFITDIVIIVPFYD